MNIFRTRAFGLFAALMTVTIWAVFLLATRFAVKGNFTVEEVLLLRLVPAALLMSPLILKFDLIPRGQSWSRSLMLMIGVSAIFPYIVSTGLAYAPASDGGALAPGMLPFWTALAAYFLAGERPGKFRKFGLLMILTGAIFVGLWQIAIGSSDGTWKGHLMFLTGSGLFAIYSVVFRQSGLSPMHGLVIGLFWGAIFITPLMFLSGNVSFADVGFRDILIMTILQSFNIGILATILFNYGVQILGAAQTGAFGALTPILAFLGGIIFLDEIATPSKFFGVLLVASGVFLASGILDRPKLKQD